MSIVKSTTAVKERVRLEQELESDRLFFAELPDDYVRCPSCSTVYAVQHSASRPATSELQLCTPTPRRAAATALALPAGFSRELPRGACLGFEDALRHLHRSRFRCAQCDTDFCRCGVAPYHYGWSCDGWQKSLKFDEAVNIGSCRWCSQPCMGKMRRSKCFANMCCGSDQGTDTQRFPPLLSCAEKQRRGCRKQHQDCGHWCGGMLDEEQCLPCLHKECYKRPPKAISSLPGASSSTAPLVLHQNLQLQQPQAPVKETSTTTTVSLLQPLPTMCDLASGDDWCAICWTEPLSAAPSIRLHCGHVLHHHCAEAMVLKGRVGGRRLTFKYTRCPLCLAALKHPSLDEMLETHIEMYHKVRRKALQRWVIEQRRPMLRRNDFLDEERIATLSLQKMTFYECSQCHEPYYGGEVECGEPEEEMEQLDDDVQAALSMELVCRGCASKGQLQCPEHGTEFLGWKCRYCCEREAHFFCFGTTHFCLSCHDLWQMGVEERRRLQAGKACLGAGRCIFGGEHPPRCRNGRDEYALGCTICAQDTECGLICAKDKGVTDVNDPSRVFQKFGAQLRRQWKGAMVALGGS